MPRHLPGPVQRSSTDNIIILDMKTYSWIYTVLISNATPLKLNLFMVIVLRVLRASASHLVFCEFIDSKGSSAARNTLRDIGRQSKRRHGI